MAGDACAEARARVERWETEVEALEKTRDRAAMAKVIEAGVMKKLDGELAEAMKHLAAAEAGRNGCLELFGPRR